jgi:ribonuclease HI
MEVWTDGCCNKKGSGWAVIVPSCKMIFRGQIDGATNQQAELSAIIQAVHFLKQRIHIITDSKYAIGCFTEWYVNWLNNGWKNAKGKPIENQSLIMLGLQMGIHNCTFQHVAGHSKNYYNDMADYYCKNNQLKPEHQDWRFINS